MLSANFNQDFTCISVGTRKGYSITNCDPFQRAHTMNDGAQGIVEPLFSTSQIALVGAADQPQSSPRKLQIVNAKRRSVIHEFIFPSPVLAVKLNRKTVAAVLEADIYIYDISGMRQLYVIKTARNPEAIVALSPSTDNPYLAYPSLVLPPTTADPPPTAAPTQQQGDITLFSTRSCTTVNVIQAHKTPISFLSINSTGTLLASASDRGTVIRVWNIPGAEKLYQLRRGTWEARIYSMNFSRTSTLLAVSSAHDTIHIFKLGPQCCFPQPHPKPLPVPGCSIGNGDDSKTVLDTGYEASIDKESDVPFGMGGQSLGFIRNFTTSFSTYVRGAMAEILEPSRDFAFLRPPTSGSRCVVAFNGTMPQVMVISADGYFYLYNLDLDNGGECSLIKRYNLLDPEEEAANDQQPPLHPLSRVHIRLE